MSNDEHWYDKGTSLPTGLTVTTSRAGRPEPVLTAKQWRRLLRDKPWHVRLRARLARVINPF
jgi:hypothetical protein